MKKLIMICAAVGFLAACGEKPQQTTGAGKDAPAYTGTGKAYAAAGWKQGDKADWEAKLKARNQYGQNDYARID